MWQLETCLWEPIVTSREKQVFVELPALMARLLFIKQYWEQFTGVEGYISNGCSAGYPRLDICLTKVVSSEWSCTVCVLSIYAIEVATVGQYQCGSVCAVLQKEVMPVI